MDNENTSTKTTASIRDLRFDDADGETMKAITATTSETATITLQATEQDINNVPVNKFKDATVTSDLKLWNLGEETNVVISDSQGTPKGTSVVAYNKECYNHTSLSSPCLSYIQNGHASTTENNHNRSTTKKEDYQNQYLKNIFTTASSRRLNIQQNKVSNELLQYKGSSGLFKDAVYLSLLSEHQEMSGKISHPSTIARANGTLPSRVLFSPSPSAENVRDSITTIHTSPGRRSRNLRSSDLDEIKSVKFRTLDDSSSLNGLRSVFRENETLRNGKSATGSNGQSQFQVQQKTTSKDHAVLRRKSDSDDNNEVTVTVRTGLCRCANLSTQRGRRNHALMIMMVSVIPVIALLIQNSVSLSDHNSQLEMHKSVKQKIYFSMEIGNVIHMTQIERGTSSLYISSKGDERVKETLLEAYAETDREIDKLTSWIAEPGTDHLDSAQSYHEWIKKFRYRLLSSPLSNITVAEVIGFYSADNAIIMRWVGTSVVWSKSRDLWRSLVGYYMLILSKEQAGVERALGSTFYAQGGLNNRQMLDYLERKILGVTYLDRCKDYSTTVKTFLMNFFTGQETDLNIQRMRSEILLNSLNGSDVEMGSMWFRNMTEYIDVLKVSGR